MEIENKRDLLGIETLDESGFILKINTSGEILGKDGRLIGKLDENETKEITMVLTQCRQYINKMGNIFHHLK